jgi:hypothetical protein
MDPLWRPNGASILTLTTPGLPSADQCADQCADRTRDPILPVSGNSTQHIRAPRLEQGFECSAQPLEKGLPFSFWGRQSRWQRQFEDFSPSENCRNWSAHAFSVPLAIGTNKLPRLGCHCSTWSESWCVSNLKSASSSATKVMNRCGSSAHWTKRRAADTT